MSIDRLTQQIERLKARRTMMEARERAAERKRNTRRRIILGGELLRQWGGVTHMPEDFRARLDAQLRRDDDRALFALPARRGFAEFESLLLIVTAGIVAVLVVALPR